MYGGEINICENPRFLWTREAHDPIRYRRRRCNIAILLVAIDTLVGVGGPKLVLYHLFDQIEESHVAHLTKKPIRLKQRCLR